jgi:transcriptional regulator with XRE-family HTH domain
MTNFKKEFGANLKALRKTRGMTQEKIAELIDLHYRQMSKIETGDNFPSGRTIEKLCYVLKVSPAELFNFNFIYEGEIVLTGTDDLPFYRAVKHGNVVLLEDYKGKKVKQEKINIFDSDNRFLTIARNLNKPLTVEYFEDGKKSKVLIYNPDGTIVNLNEKKQYSNQETENLIALFKKISNNKDYTDFIKLAIQSIEDDKALERLEFMINGIKMARSNKR